MKYIKKFEKKSFLEAIQQFEKIFSFKGERTSYYNVGDYVEIKYIPNYCEYTIDESDKVNLYAIITKIDLINKIFNFKLADGKIIYGYVYLIRKLLNEKEINEYKFRCAAKNYNL